MLVSRSRPRRGAQSEARAKMTSVRRLRVEAQDAEGRHGAVASGDAQPWARSDSEIPTAPTVESPQNQAESRAYVIASPQSRIWAIWAEGRPWGEDASMCVCRRMLCGEAQDTIVNVQPEVFRPRKPSRKSRAEWICREESRVADRLLMLGNVVEA